ncbi:MAG TPA: preprotein translocase subunit YajC [Bacilli bacterium]
MLNIAAEQTATAGSTLTTLVLPFVLMFAVFYFLLIRPQQKRQKARTAMLRDLKKGDKIVTIGGIHGTIQELNEDTVILKVNDTTKLTFDRTAISSVTAQAEKTNS